MLLKSAGLCGHNLLDEENLQNLSINRIVKEFFGYFQTLSQGELFKEPSISFGLDIFFLRKFNILEEKAFFDQRPFIFHKISLPLIDAY